MTTTNTRHPGDRRPSGAAVSETVVSETAVSDTVVSDTAVSDTAVSVPAAPDRTVADRSVADRSVADPALSDTVVSDPAVSRTLVSQTVVSEALLSETVVSEPLASELPAPVRSTSALSGAAPTAAPPAVPASPGPSADPATVILPSLPATGRSAGPRDQGRRPGPPPEPEPMPGRWRWASPVLALLAVALLPLAAATTDLDALDGWGLATVLGPAAWAALACAVGACVAELRAPRPRIPMLATATGVLVLCSTGLPSVVQPVARFTTSYVIDGFVDAIAGRGVAPQDVDARFFWPAFFAQWAWFRDAAGAPDLDVVLRWFPPAVVLVWTIGVYALARSMLGGTRAPWVAAWLFVGLNWIEQDYFSPQAEGIVLMLTALTFALGPLATRRTDAAGVPGWPAAHPDAPRLPLLRRWLVSALTPPNRPTLPPRQLLLIYVCVALCLVALAPEHQLTPFAIIGQLALLAVVGRFRGRGLVVVAVVALSVYFVVGARDFWMSQIGLLLGSDDGGNALQTGIADRLAGDRGQVVVKLLRIAVPGLTWLLAIAGAWTYWRRRRDLVPIFLAVVPMAFAAQGYGGEVFLRIVLYGLPVLTILAVDGLRAHVRRARDGGRAVRETRLAVAMLLLFPVLVLIRGGNDAYMLVTPEDLAMTRAAYAEAPPGSKVVPMDETGPYAMEGVGVDQRGGDAASCQDEVKKTAADVTRCITDDEPDVVLVYTSSEKKGVVLDHRPPGWTRDVVNTLVASGNYRIRYQHGFNAVLVRSAPTVINAPVDGAPDGGN